MIGRFFEQAKQFFALKAQIDKNTADIWDIQLQVNNLTATVAELLFVVRRNEENAAHEREKLMLRLENALLKFERRLPPGEGSGRDLT